MRLNVTLVHNTNWMMYLTLLIEQCITLLYLLQLIIGSDGRHRMEL